MLLYRGLSRSRGDAIVDGTDRIAATSNGEFGNGSYYWINDKAAAVLSAVQYYGQDPGGWAVLEIDVGDRVKTDIVRGAILNFRAPRKNRPADHSTATTHGLAGTKNQLTWPNYQVIAGPTAAAPNEVNLTQVKFSGQSLDILNGGPKRVVHYGPQLSGTTYSRVRSWRLEDRRSIYLKYCEGKAEVVFAL
ncbi:MAG: hypothetical protein ACYTJ0_09135 [Planctomycetota bacterium]|jgi:hypothetical protein